MGNAAISSNSRVEYFGYPTDLKDGGAILETALRDAVQLYTSANDKHNDEH